MKRNDRVIVRDQPLNAGLNRCQHLPDVRVGPDRLAEFEYQRFFRALAIGEVTCDLGEAEEPAVLPPQGGDDDISPKA